MYTMQKLYRGLQFSNFPMKAGFKLFPYLVTRTRTVRLFIIDECRDDFLLNDNDIYE